MEGISYYTITREDVGKSTLYIFGKSLNVATFMSTTIQPDDIGKRIHQDWATFALSIETDSQRAARERGYGGRS